MIVSDNAVFSQGNPATPLSVNPMNTIASNIDKLPINNTSVVSTMSASVLNSTLFLPVKALVSESCFKEALPCELSPLGYHLSTAVKEKIWRGKFIDILSSLPSSKKFLWKSVKRTDERSKEDRRRVFTRTGFKPYVFFIL